MFLRVIARVRQVNIGDLAKAISIQFHAINALVSARMADLLSSKTH